MHRKGGSGVLVDDLYHSVHVDKRWFYILITDGRGVYLQPTEDPPKIPQAQNKRYITKVISLVDVSRRRKVSNRVWFDRKVGILSPIMDIKVHSVLQQTPTCQS
ncbi:unnamed protein product [Choristocarpus tenellus]